MLLVWGGELYYLNQNMYATPTWSLWLHWTRWGLDSNHLVHDLNIPALFVLPCFLRSNGGRVSLLLFAYDTLTPTHKQFNSLPLPPQIINTRKQTNQTKKKNSTTFQTFSQFDFPPFFFSLLSNTFFLKNSIQLSTYN